MKLKNYPLFPPTSPPPTRGRWAATYPGMAPISRASPEKSYLYLYYTPSGTRPPTSTFSAVRRDAPRGAPANYLVNQLDSRLLLLNTQYSRLARSSPSPRPTLLRCPSGYLRPHRDHPASPYALRRASRSRLQGAPLSPLNTQHSLFSRIPPLPINHSPSPILIRPSSPCPWAPPAGRASCCLPRPTPTGRGPRSTPARPTARCRRPPATETPPND